MDDIRQERHNEGPSLKFNKELYGQSLNLKKEFDIHLEKSMVFKTVFIPRNKVAGRKPT